MEIEGGKGRIVGIGDKVSPVPSAVGNGSKLPPPTLPLKQQKREKKPTNEEVKKDNIGPSFIVDVERSVHEGNGVVMPEGYGPDGKPLMPRTSR